MTDITIDAGTLVLAAGDGRTVTGLLVPYGEQCTSNLGRFEVGTGAFALPADVSIAGINLEHAREQPLGRATAITETAQGIVATFSIANTPEGDAALTDIAQGTRKHLSAEVADVVIRAGKAIGGRLFGAALVAKPAFPSATLLAAAPDTGTTTGGDPAVSDSSFESHETGPDGSAYDSKTETTEEVVDNDDGSQTITRTTTTTTTITPPEDQPVTDQTPPVPATVPAPLLANRRPAPKAPERSGLGLPTLLAMLAEAHRTQDERVLEALKGASKGAIATQSTLFAALTDVAITGAGAPAANISQPQWLGELWSGKAYARRYWGLINSGPLTSFTFSGFKFTRGPELQKWAGNKTAIPSNPVTTAPYSGTAQRFATGNDIAREYRDFPNPEFWDGYFRLGTESYAKVSDAYVIEELLADGANTPVTAEAAPSGVSPVMAKIVDGALAVLDEDSPSFAIVGKADYRSLLLTRTQDMLAYLNSALGLEEGTIDSFRVVPSSDAAFADGHALVGCKSAATARELSGTPIRVEGLDMVKGGIDPGLFGYAGVQIDNPAALAYVAPAA